MTCSTASGSLASPRSYSDPDSIQTPDDVRRDFESCLAAGNVALLGRATDYMDLATFYRNKTFSIVTSTHPSYVPEAQVATRGIPAD